MRTIVCTEQIFCTCGTRAEYSRFSRKLAAVFYEERAANQESVQRFTISLRRSIQLTFEQTPAFTWIKTNSR
jgi:hypothetical protein